MTGNVRATVTGDSGALTARLCVSDGGLRPVATSNWGGSTGRLETGDWQGQSGWAFLARGSQTGDSGVDRGISHAGLRPVTRETTGAFHMEVSDR